MVKVFNGKVLSNQIFIILCVLYCKPIGKSVDLWIASLWLMHSGGVIQWEGFRLHREPCHCSQSVKGCGGEQIHSRATLAIDAEAVLYILMLL